MLMLKALFFDLDGTLLNSQKKISQKTRESLEKCKEMGYKLFIATARPPLLDRMLSWDKDILSLFDGGSYHNGGCIKIGEYKDYLPVSDEIVQNVINQVLVYDNLNIALQLENEKHAFRLPLEDKDYECWGVTSDEVLSLNQVGNLKTIKLLVFYSNLEDSVTPINESLVSSLSGMCADNSQFYLTDKGKCVMIMGASVNKFVSIEKIRKQFGYEKDEIAVFGDDVNDMEMLSEYQFSIAMGNAEPHIKNAAKYVTLDNNSDGIEHAVYKILNLL